jgi:hypothetical protein
MIQKIYYYFIAIVTGFLGLSYFIDLISPCLLGRLSYLGFSYLVYLVFLILAYNSFYLTKIGMVISHFLLIIMIVGFYILELNWNLGKVLFYSAFVLIVWFQLNAVFRHNMNERRIVVLILILAIMHMFFLSIAQAKFIPSSIMTLIIGLLCCVVSCTVFIRLYAMKQHVESTEIDSE